MTAALVCAALALAVWPGRDAVRRDRLAAVRGGPAPSRSRDAVPVPVLAGVLAAAVGAVLSTPLVAVLAGAGAVVAARAWVAGRRNRQGSAHLLLVTEGLSALAADLRSGRSLDAATEAAVAACADEEIGRALARAVRIGEVHPSITDDALRQALGRIAAGVRLSGRTGCSLAAVAAAVEDDLRARHRQHLELRSATAGPRASATVLAGLPVLGLAMGSGVGADPWQVLTTTAVGQVLLVAGVALEAVGLVWSRRLVDRALR